MIAAVKKIEMISTTKPQLTTALLFQGSSHYTLQGGFALLTSLPNPPLPNGTGTFQKLQFKQGSRHLLLQGSSFQLPLQGSSPLLLL
jgi:hypothetical protein